MLASLTHLSRDNRIMIISLLLWGMGEGMFFYIQPLYLKQLGADPTAIGSILALAALAAGISHIPAGYVADHFGRKHVLVASWVLGFVATIGMFLAPNLVWFGPCLVAYTFTGFALAALNAYVSEARSVQTVQRALTLTSAGFWTGALISPALGGWITQEYGVRTVFGVATSVFALSTLTLLTLRAQPVVPVAQGESRYGELLRNRRFIVFNGLIFICVLAAQIGLPLMANFIHEVRGLDVSLVSALGSFNAAGIIALNLVLGQRPPRRSFMIAQSLLLAALALLLLMPGFPALALVFFLRAGAQLMHTLGLALVGRLVAPAEIGLAYGITETSFSAGQILGPFLAGWLYSVQPALPFQISLGLIALTLLAFWRFAPRKSVVSADFAD
jgi:DHA1 family multidrug resistance protein-like MFS transporter